MSSRALSLRGSTLVSQIKFKEKISSFNCAGLWLICSRKICTDYRSLSQRQSLTTKISIDLSVLCSFATLKLHSFGWCNEVFKRLAQLVIYFVDFKALSFTRYGIFFCIALVSFNRFITRLDNGSRISIEECDRRTIQKFNILAISRACRLYFRIG